MKRDLYRDEIHDGLILTVIHEGEAIWRFIPSIVAQELTEEDFQDYINFTFDYMEKRIEKDKKDVQSGA